MGTSNYIILLILVFFGYVFYSIHLDEKRKLDRRQKRLPHGAERRKYDRRKANIYSYAAWVIRSQKFKFHKRLF